MIPFPPEPSATTGFARNSAIHDPQSAIHR